jgi:fructoselysine-6-P-deglycase FrlB-like protein
VEQFLHGLQVSVVSDDAVLLFGGPGAGEERTRDAARFAAALGSRVAWVGSSAAPDGAFELRIDAVDELLAPIVEVIPAQLLAGHLAALADVDADVFRGDDEAFRAARAALDL